MPSRPWSYWSRHHFAIFLQTAKRLLSFKALSMRPVSDVLERFRLAHGNYPIPRHSRTAVYRPDARTTSSAANHCIIASNPTANSSSTPSIWNEKDDNGVIG